MAVLVSIETAPVLRRLEVLRQPMARHVVGNHLDGAGIVARDLGCPDRHEPGLAEGGEAADALPDGVLHRAHVPQGAQHLDRVVGPVGPDVPDPEAVAKARLRQHDRFDEDLSHAVPPVVQRLRRPLGPGTIFP